MDTFDFSVSPALGRSAGVSVSAQSCMVGHLLRVSKTDQDCDEERLISDESSQNNNKQKNKQISFDGCSEASPSSHMSL